MKHIVIVYTDAGGGHKAAALALQTVLQREGDYRVTLVNVYTEIIPDLDAFRCTPYSGEEIYNRFIQGKGWTGAFCLSFYAIVMLSIQLQWPKGLAKLEAYWQQNEPDLVISVIPMLNSLLSKSLQRFSIPFLVLMTDLREPQKYAWLPKTDDCTIICGSEDAYRDALKKPHPEANLVQTSGLAVHPSFYEFEPIDVAKEREKHGLRADLKTGCMLYGGSGSLRMVQLAESLKKVPGEFQMIFLCGNHAEAAEKIEALQLPFPYLILGYTRQIPYFMAMADFFVGKPGPGSLSEAMIMGLPVFLDRKNLLLQERYNLKWVDQHSVGASFRSLSSFRSGFAQFLDAQAIDDMKTRVKQLNNRAIFEIPPVIRKLLDSPHQT